MTLMLRYFLIVCALLVLVFIIRKLKKAQIQVLDSIFWLLFALSFVILAAFPQIAYALSGLLGFESPSNFVFLYVIAVLVYREFTNTVKFSRQRRRLDSLVQEVALKDKQGSKER